MSDLKEQILAVIGQPVLGVLATVAADGKPWARFVVAQAEADLTIHVATFLGSRKVAQLRQNPEAHITVGRNTMESMGHPYLQIAGRAEISTDPEVKRKYWHDGLKSYFKGPDDPNYCVLLIRPYRIECMSFESQAPQVWQA